MEDKVLAGVWIAGGIILGFVIFSYLSPYLGSIAPVPTA
jgi:hypothetical protein